MYKYAPHPSLPDNLGKTPINVDSLAFGPCGLYQHIPVRNRRKNKVTTQSTGNMEINILSILNRTSKNAYQ
jgi:hypothetical protein